MSVNPISKLHKDPLLHFLVAGALLFLIFDFLPQEPPDNARSIQVGTDQLLPLIINRNPRLGPEEAAEYLVSLDQNDRSALVETYIREEVMFREAVALGLDKNNYAARRRLIAQLEYINQGFIRDSLVITNDEMQVYYADHRDRYFITAQVTFTHVYFSADQPNDEAHSLAEEELLHLNASRLPFHQAASRGDHFLYHRNYVNKGEQEVASHFGHGFAEDMFALTVSDTDWQGPLQSSFGYHLVLLTSFKPGYYPQLDEIRARVEDDVTQVRIREEIDRFYKEVRSTYFVTVVETERTL
jgi:hypothetical protein|tara:strand:- start:1741 stop:2637 length:897 start_codon:yes stop_codon:yes gene_type:complete